MLCIGEDFDDFNDCVRDLAMMMHMCVVYDNVLLKRGEADPFFDDIRRGVDRLLEKGIRDQPQDSFYYDIRVDYDLMEDLFLDMVDRVLDPFEAFKVERFLTVGDPEKSIRKLARDSLINSLRRN